VGKFTYLETPVTFLLLELYGARLEMNRWGVKAFNLF
jgi:hypothetical protein